MKAIEEPQIPMDFIVFALRMMCENEASELHLNITELLHKRNRWEKCSGTRVIYYLHRRKEIKQKRHN
jgi:hypothetical protein